MSALAFFEIGFSEMVVVGVVALLLFGGRLPEVMRTLGSTYRSFRRGFDDLSRQAMRPDLMAPPYQPIPPAATKPPPGAVTAASRTTVPAPWAAATPTVATVPAPAMGPSMGQPSGHPSGQPSGPAAFASPAPPPPSPVPPTLCGLRRQGARPARSVDDDVPFV